MEPDARAVRAGEQLDWDRLVSWLRERLPGCGIAGLDVRVRTGDRAVPRRSFEPHLSASLRRHRHRCSPPAVRAGAANRARYGARIPLAGGDASGLSAGAATISCSARTSASSARCSTRWNAATASSSAPTNRRRLRTRRHDVGSASRSSIRWSRFMPSTSPRTASTPSASPPDFVERQVRGWTDRWHRSQTTPLPEMDALADYLRASSAA